MGCLLINEFSNSGLTVQIYPLEPSSYMRPNAWFFEMTQRMKMRFFSHTNHSKPFKRCFAKSSLASWNSWAGGYGVGCSTIACNLSNFVSQHVVGSGALCCEHGRFSILPWQTASFITDLDYINDSFIKHGSNWDIIFWALCAL